MPSGSAGNLYYLPTWLGWTAKYLSAAVCLNSVIIDDELLAHLVIHQHLHSNRMVQFYNLACEHSRISKILLETV